MTIFLFNKIQWQNNGTRSISFLSPLIQYHLSIFFFLFTLLIVSLRINFPFVLHNRCNNLLQARARVESPAQNTNFSSEFSIQHSYPVFHRT